jgi:hypothetical protein
MCNAGLEILGPILSLGQRRIRAAWPCEKHVTELQLLHICQLYGLTECNLWAYKGLYQNT